MLQICVLFLSLMHVVSLEDFPDFLSDSFVVDVLEDKEDNKPEFPIVLGVAVPIILSLLLGMRQTCAVKMRRSAMPAQNVKLAEYFNCSLHIWYSFRSGCNMV